MTITINNQTFDLTDEQITKLRKALNLNGKQLSEVAVGDTFKVADIEFIKFADEDGITTAVARDVLFNAKFDKDWNKFSESSLLRKLKTEVLPKIEAAIGADNVVEFETDLLSMDGLDDYGTVKSKISLPTVDFYRKHVRIFDKYKVKTWWWTCTPDSTPTHGSDIYVRYVNDGGSLSCSNCSVDLRVRPFLRFVSSIFVS